MGVSSCELNLNYFDAHPQKDENQNATKPDWSLCRKEQMETGTTSTDQCGLNTGMEKRFLKI